MKVVLLKIYTVIIATSPHLLASTRRHRTMVAMIIGTLADGLRILYR